MSTVYSKILYAKGVVDASITPEGESTGMDLLGIKDITFKLDMYNEVLSGDEQNLDVYAGVEGAEIEIKDMAFANLETLAALLGVELTEDTTAITLPIKAQEVPYFALEFYTDRLTGLLSADQTAPKKVLVSVPKVKITSLDNVAKHKGYWGISFKAKAIPNADGVALNIQYVK